ncbi:MAG: hypothetical protein A2571_00710 [Candidatus Vogelbacteria bacterium RIFOXYD1_FULL_44_32]|uniref:Uncharacterized protein n=1 Tax=Candidatus Vogelbacteria bacterium RIFOXYD1_FULL_44_32 TaxID=1802438 RepID=A0A1G2QEN6_9BACT|nr:MAG: hypothetical protein A2571_00710 [Candidatus Vogelbacteria bacterium RIFOXYD1_FULL_44_32]
MNPHDDFRPRDLHLPSTAPSAPAKVAPQTTQPGRFKQAKDIASRLWALEGKNSRVNNTTAMLMVAVAFFCFNLPQIILEWLLIGFLFNWIITTFAWLTMWFWFRLHGVGFINPTRLVTLTLSALIDYFPGADASIVFGFTWTIGTIILIAIVRAEDMTGINIEKIIKGKFASLKE